MDFRELNYVIALAKHQNITKAAASLYITQPTLSKFLISLEENLGQRLFRKIGHKYILTYAGERYVEKAGQILNLKNDLDTELADIMKNDVGVLKVAFPHMRCTYMLPKTLPDFQKMYPNVKVHVLEGSSTENDQRILEGQADIAFFSKPNDTNPLIEYETLRKEEMLICTCKEHPLKHFSRPNPASNFPKLDPALLKNELVLQLMPEQRTRQITDDYFHEHNLTFPNIMYTSNLPAIMELVTVGYGVSFIFETHLRHRVKTGPIDCYSFGDPKTSSDFVVAYRKGSYLPTYAKDYIEIARRLFY
ncbi:LysR family transcriptional regulator [Lachnospiraceae bacterium OttesenSCG-928-D06]|nr:LysR family transcriptional regulator [Lachnospiraceae bacterium OttesenSCG-928-D06]